MAKQSEKKQGKGRPDKLTDDVQAAIVKWLEEGGFVENACHMVGISKVTYYTWRRLGREQRRGKYRNFLNATNKAQARAQTKLVSMIESAARRDWKAAAWVLTRMNPGVFMQTERMELTGKKGRPIQHDHKRSADDYTDDELAAIIAAGKGKGKKRA